MAILYEDKLDVKDYLKLRSIVGWTIFPEEQAIEGIKHTFFVLSVRDSDRDITIGCIRLLWDYGYTAYIADVIVHPDYQGQGIGRHMMEKALDTLKANMKPGYKIMINLMSAKGKNEFYEKFGFISRPNDNFGPGMFQWISKENE